jgi:exodeoxyribonuclease VII large subunit
VVTSPTGAVIRDILHRIRERFPVRVIVWPALVQGELAAAQITAGIQGLNALTGPDRPDLIIVARGGGSIEDLWPFNEESVVRAAAASAIPLISGVGHETDTTLIDHAADVRAPTPTGAAEMAVPVRTELMLDVSAKANRLIRALARTSQLAASHLKAVAVRLPAPERLFETRAQRVDRAGSRLASALGRRAARARATFLTLSGRLPRPQGLIQPRRDALIREARDLTRALQTRVQRARNALTLPASRLRPDTVARETLRQREAVTRLDARASRAIQRRLEGASARLSASARLIETLSYTSVLARGFVLVRDASGQVLRGVADARSASTLHLSFADGTLRAMPLPDTGSPPPEPAPETSPARRPRPRKPPGSSATPQSSLFDTGEA